MSSPNSRGAAPARPPSPPLVSASGLTEMLRDPHPTPNATQWYPTAFKCHLMVFESPKCHLMAFGFLNATKWNSKKINTYPVPVTSYLVPGTWYLAPGTWYQVHGTSHMVLVLGTRYLVPGTWYQAPGTRYPLPGTWYHLAPGSNGVQLALANQNCNNND